jgi:hypothetical protein
MNDFISTLRSPIASIRARAADECGRWHAIVAEDVLRILLNDASPVVTHRGERKGVGEVRFTAVTALQRILLHHKKPIDLGEVTVRKVMFEEEVLQRYCALEERAVIAVTPRVDAILSERVRPDADDESLIRAYVVLQCIDLIEYRKERVDPSTYSTPLQEEVRISQLVSARPRPHLRVADASDPARLFGYVYRNSFGRYVVDFAEGPGSDNAVEKLTRLLDSKVKRVVLEGDRTARNPDGSAQWGEPLDFEHADPLEVLRSLRVFVERYYDATIVTD